MSNGAVWTSDPPSRRSRFPELGQLGRATTLQIMLTNPIVCQRHGCPQGGAHTRAALATNPAARHLSSGARFRCYDEAERSRVSLPEPTTHS